MHPYKPMTPDTRIDQLEKRVDRLDNQYREDIVAIHQKLDVLTNAINEVLVKSARIECPSPGACIALSERLSAQVVAHNATMLRVERLELRLMDVEKWQWKMIGVISSIMVILTLFGPAIRKAFGLP